MAKEKSNIYLDYLDKEMTIMGILSTFCVILAGGALDRISGSENKYFVEIWTNGKTFIILGSVYALLAALFFYLQRSFLAWYFGQISLCIAKGNEKGVHKKKEEKTEDDYGINDWYKEADSWPTWIRYNFAFAFLILSFFEYSLGLINTRFSCINAHEMICLFAPILIISPFYIFWFFLILKYPYEDNPLKTFLHPTLKATENKQDITYKNSNNAFPVDAIADNGVEHHDSSKISDSPVETPPPHVLKSKI